MDVLTDDCLSARSVSTPAMKPRPSRIPKIACKYVTQSFITETVIRSPEKSDLNLSLIEVLSLHTLISIQLGYYGLLLVGLLLTIMYLLTHIV